MYARLDQLSGRPGHGSDSANPAHFSTGVTGPAGLLGTITFRQLAGPATACVTLWDSEASATGFPAPDARLTTSSAEVYQVADAEAGPAAAQAPTHARLIYFDGPRAPEQAAAEEWAGRQRIWPVVRGIGGLVGVYVLRGPDFGTVVITLATSVETLDATARAIMATELLPGEDPALLPGPDRIEVHHVTGYDAPAIRHDRRPTR